jgi:hypothetical protein
VSYNVKGMLLMAMEICNDSVPERVCFTMPHRIGLNVLLDRNYKEESEKLEKEGVIPRNSGYSYNHWQAGLPLIEYHVDICDFFKCRYL